MKQKLFYTLIVVVGIMSCRRDNISGPDNTLNGEWKLVKYKSSSSGASEIEPVDIARSIIIRFSDNTIKGAMNGQTVTNAVSGEYELGGQGKMKTLSFGGTKVGEPNWGERFWDAIHAASSYQRKHDKLYIYFNADAEIMEFVKQ